ncbi:MAG TPA: magnesium chelatase domain-containing protein, partial [Amycolatopsis sp.]|nr:magnesium chelatase domain-containing protein [Amycolatopsis sp.]
GVPDPSGLFMSRTPEPVPGTAITVSVEGKRPLLGEVQALVSPTTAPQPRRAVSGLDSSRVAMVLAVLEKRGNLQMHNKDVYVATVGGMKITEPGIDLALALALVSSCHDVPLSPRLVSVGEVGLAGEIRRVPSVGRRLAEAARLGFTYALVPPDSGKLPAGIRVLEVANVSDALNAAKHAR